MTNTNTIQVREIALEALLEILEKGRLSHLVLGQFLRKYQYLEKQDRAFLSRLVEGTIERKLTLDYILDQYSKKVSVQKMKPVIRTLLRMGSYQILYMDGVPDSAACNETVKLTIRRGFSGLKGFVNGILRTIAREKEQIPFPEKGSLEYYSVVYSMPEWIVEQWMEQYGQKITEKMLLAGLEAKAVTVRIRTGTLQWEEGEKSLLKEADVQEVFWYPEAWILSDYDSFEELESFQSGAIQVQDISSMMVAEAAGVKEGDFILDVCAAPGGKSIHLADKLQGTGCVEARDLTDYKIGLIEENAQRCRVNNLRVKRWDALEFDKTMAEAADIVIADLPCSGLGVVGRKNDLKYHSSREGQRELVQLQRKILMTVSAYVKAGGVLIYSTCTTNRQENEENVRWFLEENPSFVLEDLTEYLPKGMTEAADPILQLKEQITSGMVGLLQGVFPSDGFFLARLKKRKG